MLTLEKLELQPSTRPAPTAPEQDLLALRMRLFYGIRPEDWPATAERIGALLRKLSTPSGDPMK